MSFQQEFEKQVDRNESSDENQITDFVDSANPEHLSPKEGLYKRSPTLKDAYSPLEIAASDLGKEIQTGIDQNNEIIEKQENLKNALPLEIMTDSSERQKKYQATVEEVLKNIEELEQLLKETNESLMMVPNKPRQNTETGAEEMVPRSYKNQIEAIRALPQRTRILNSRLDSFEEFYAETIAHIRKTALHDVAEKLPGRIPKELSAPDYLEKVTQALRQGSRIKYLLHQAGETTLNKEEEKAIVNQFAIEISEIYAEISILLAKWEKKGLDLKNLPFYQEELNPRNFFYDEFERQGIFRKTLPFSIKEINPQTILNIFKEKEIPKDNSLLKIIYLTQKHLRSCKQKLIDALRKAEKKSPALEEIQLKPTEEPFNPEIKIIREDDRSIVEVDFSRGGTDENLESLADSLKETHDLEEMSVEDINPSQQLNLTLGEPQEDLSNPDVEAIGNQVVDLSDQEPLYTEQETDEDEEIKGVDADEEVIDEDLADEETSEEEPPEGEAAQDEPSEIEDTETKGESGPKTDSKLEAMAAPILKALIPRDCAEIRLWVDKKIEELERLEIFTNKSKINKAVFAPVIGNEGTAKNIVYGNSGYIDDEEFPKVTINWENYVKGLCAQKLSEAEQSKPEETDQKASSGRQAKITLEQLSKELLVGNSVAEIAEKYGVTPPWIYQLQKKLSAQRELEKAKSSGGQKKKARMIN